LTLKKTKTTNLPVAAVGSIHAQEARMTFDSVGSEDAKLQTENNPT